MLQGKGTHVQQRVWKQFLPLADSEVALGMPTEQVFQDFQTKKGFTKIDAVYIWQYIFMDKYEGQIFVFFKHMEFWSNVNIICSFVQFSDIRLILEPIN